MLNMISFKEYIIAAILLTIVIIDLFGGLQGALTETLKGVLASF